jgi:hypothetical protein
MDENQVHPSITADAWGVGEIADSGAAVRADEFQAVVVGSPSVLGGKCHPVDDCDPASSGSAAAVGEDTPAVRNPRPRSLLRGGTALDGLVPGRPLVDSLLQRVHLRQIGAPAEGSDDFTICRRFERQLTKAAKGVAACDPFELEAVARGAIARLHGPKVRDISRRKLPANIPNDPIDPVVIFVEALPLAYRVLHLDATDNAGLDLDGVAYMIERLGEVERLRTEPKDIRFNVLQALSAFLAAVLAKAEEECWACVEAA